MNYFEFYAGDYLRDTADLSLAEHGAYVLLMASYYSAERALPADAGSLHRIARAMNKAEQGAVDRVAARFFPVADDGLRHNARADREIAKAQTRIEAARANGTHGGRPKKANQNPKQTQQEPTGFSLGTPAETHSGEALHAPRASNSVGKTEQAPEASQVGGTEAGRACKLMKAAGAGARVNPSHADLVAALAEGVTPEVLADTVREGVDGGKSSPFLWAIATARARHAAGPAPVTQGQRRQVEAPTGGASRQSKEQALAPLESRLKQQLRWLHGELESGRMTRSTYDTNVASARETLKDAA